MGKALSAPIITTNLFQVNLGVLALQVVQKQSQIYSRRAFHSMKNLDNSETGGKHIGNILGNFPEITKTVEF